MLARWIQETKEIDFPLEKSSSIWTHWVNFWFLHNILSLLWTSPTYEPASYEKAVDTIEQNRC